MMRDKGCLIKVDEMSIWLQQLKVKKKQAITRVHVINNSCFNGKGALGSLDSNNKKARFVKDEGCLLWTR